MIHLRMIQDWDPTGQTDGPKKGDIVTVDSHSLQEILNGSYGFAFFNGAHYDVVKREVEVAL